MSLTAPAKTERTSSAKQRVAQAELEVGNYPCRVAQVIDLGVHHKDIWDDKIKKYVKDVSKPPVAHAMLTYEFVSEFMKDEEGNDVEDKPRWHSETLPIYALDSDLATSTKRMKAFDPTFDKFKGNFAALAAEPCTVTVGHRQNGKAKIGNVSPPMKGFPVPELKNPVKVFMMDTPDLEVFKSLPTWLQERIQEALNYKGSELERALGGASSVETKPEPTHYEEPVEDEDAGDDSAPW